MDIKYYKKILKIKDIKKVLLSNKHVLSIKKEIKENGMLYYIIKEYSFLNGKGVSQIIWHFKNEVYEPVLCKICDKGVRYVNINKGYVKYCSNKCQLKDHWSNVSEDFILTREEKRKKTCIEKYGVEHATMLESIKEKTKETNRRKYNSDYHLSTSNYRNRLKKILMYKYGVDNISKLDIIKEKKKVKSLNKTPREKKLIREKYRNTILERYGVEHLSQDSDFLENVLKKSFSHKSYRLPSGKVISLQGYEPNIMDYLLKYYEEDDILYTNKSIEGKIGKIFYKNKNRLSRYFPDLYIISENKIIEVKSTFTYNLDIDKNNLKKEECLNRGIMFDFMIYDNINDKVIKL